MMPSFYKASVILCAMLSTNTDLAYACNESLLRIAETIDSESIYTRIDKDHCEGRYGGLISTGKNQLVRLLGFENDFNGEEKLWAKDSISIEWPSDTTNNDFVSGFYMQPKLFYRMDAQPSISGQYEWNLEKLISVYKFPTVRRKLSIAVSRLSRSGDRIWLPATTSSTTDKNSYRFAFEILANMVSLNWTISRRESKEDVIQEHTAQDISRDVLINFILPINKLGDEGEFLIKLTGTLSNGDTIQQDIVFLHAYL